MTDPKPSRYQQAGVDIDKGNAFVQNIKELVASTHQRGVVNQIGGFSSLFAIDQGKYTAPILVSSTDGVGTKLAIAKLCGRHDTIGIDLVAMCVNDIVVSGARPLFFLDYFAVDRLDLEVATEVIKGIAAGCRLAKCSLVGGETAEMPGLYRPGDYDLAGFVTGIVDRDEIVDGSTIRVGNKIIGLASDGLHSNGYSLVRQIIFTELGLKVEDRPEALDCSVGEELLKPTRIYVQPILNLLKNYRINGMVHNTGGGFIDNIPRVLPRDCKAVIDTSRWPIPPIFTFLEENGRVPRAEMFRTFNMGIGYLCLVDAADSEDILHHLRALGETPFEIGTIEPLSDGSEPVELA